jgi:hypothetical protein
LVNIRNPPSTAGKIGQARKNQGTIAQKLYDHLEKKYGLIYEEFNQEVD